MRGIDLPWSTQMIWSLETTGAGELWCGVIPGGLFRSIDGGDSWNLVRALWDDPRRRKWVGGGFDFAGSIRFLSIRVILRMSLWAFL